MNIAEESSSWISQKIINSNAVLRVLGCCSRLVDVRDILLVRKDSLVLLVQEEEGLWATKLEQSLATIVKHAVVLSRRGQRDVVILSDGKGALYFLRYKTDKFEMLHETHAFMPGPWDEFQNIHNLCVDQVGRVFATLAPLNTVTLYMLSQSRATDALSFSARHHLHLEGLLLRACFVVHNKGLMSLVVHTVFGNQASLGLFHWREGQFPSALKPRMMPLDRRMRICLHLVALKQRPGYFIHVSDHRVALISAHDVECGSLEFESCDMNLSSETVSHVQDISTADGEQLALLATDRGKLFLLQLDGHNYLKLRPCGGLDFAPITSSLILETRPELSAWEVFFCSDHGSSGLYTVRTSGHHTPMFIESNSLPQVDVVVIPSNSGSVKAHVVSVSGRDNTGQLAFPSRGLEMVDIQTIDWEDTSVRAPERLFSFVDQYGSSCILVSMPWGTQLLQHDPDDHILIDMSEDYGVQSTLSTLHFHVFRDSLLQITQQGVSTCKTGQGSTQHILSLEESQRVIAADAFEDIVVYVVAQEEQYHLHVAAVAKKEEGGHQLQSLSPAHLLVSEPSNIRIITAKDGRRNDLLMSFTDGQIVQLEWPHATTLSVSWDISPPTRDSELTDNLVVHDYFSIEIDAVVHVLISYRSGLLCHYMIIDDQPSFSESFQTDGPITFLPHPARGAQELYFSGNETGRIVFHDNAMMLERFVFADGTPEAIFHVRDPFFDISTMSGFRQTGVLSYAAGRLTFSHVPSRAELCRDYEVLAETPRRILHAPHLNGLLIATNKALEVDTDEQHVPRHIANIQIIQNRMCVSDDTICDTKKQVPLFRPGDTIYAMAHWRVLIGETERNWTVVGSSRKNFKTNAIEGRLFVLRFKQHGKRIGVRKEFSPSYPAPITALCELDRKRLVIGHGTTLEITMLDEGSRGALTKQSFVNLRSSVIALHVRGSFIFAATQKDSIMIFKDTNEGLQRVAADPFPKLSLSLTMAPQDVIVLTDKLKTIHLFKWNSESMKMDLSSTIVMPTVIVKTDVFPVVGLRDPDIAKIVLDEHVILAAGIDGSLHVLIRIHPRLGRLVKDQQALQKLFSPASLSKQVDALVSDDLLTQMTFDADEMLPVEAIDLRRALLKTLRDYTTHLLA